MELSAAQETIRRWRKGGPCLFAREVLGATPTPQQEEAGRALVERRRLSIRSGHGTGKSAFLAWCVLWFQSCYFPCKVPCTAPTAHQLGDVLWAELAAWHRQMRERVPELGAEFVWTSERFTLVSNESESFAVARTSRPERPEALQGFHAQNLLFLIDEASGVPEQVFEVAEGALSTPGAFVVMAANPTRQDGYFYESHNRMRDSWAALHWDGEQSPLVSAQYIADMRKKYGEDSPIYQVRVRGNFATAIDGVIALELCEAARVREVAPTDAPLVWGIDPARFGDDATGFAVRQGNTQPEPTDQWTNKDTMQTVGIIKQRYDAAKRKPDTITVDVIGIGAGVVDRLRELGLPVSGINVAESAAASDRYNRLRDELWWRGREWLEAKDCRMADDDALIGELTTPKYSILSSGKIKVEGKDELRKRGVASPNRADAWLLTFADVASRRNTNAPLHYRRLHG